MIRICQLFGFYLALDVEKHIHVIYQIQRTIAHDLAAILKSVEWKGKNMIRESKNVSFHARQTTQV